MAISSVGRAFLSLLALLLHLAQISAEEKVQDETSDPAELLERGKLWYFEAAASRSEAQALWSMRYLKKCISELERPSSSSSSSPDHSNKHWRRRDLHASRTRLAAAYYYLGANLRMLERNEEARSALHQVKMMMPKSLATHAQLGALEEELHNWTAAEEAYEAWSMLAPRTVKALNALGWVKFRAGKSQEAVGLFMQAARLRPDDPETFYTLARGAELYGGESTEFYSASVVPNFTRAYWLSSKSWASRMCKRLDNSRPEDPTRCEEPAVVERWREEKHNRITSVATLSAGGFDYGAEEEATSDSFEPGKEAIGRAAFEWGRRQKYREREVVHVTLRNVYVSGNDAVIWDEEGRVYATHQGVQIPLYANLPSARCPPANSSTPRLSETLLLSLAFGPGFYHWLVDAMPRACLALPRISPSSTVLVPSDYGAFHSFILELLRLLGIPRERITPYNIVAQHQGEEESSCARVWVEKLHVVDWRKGAEDTRLDTHHLPPRHAMRSLRATMLTRLGLLDVDQAGRWPHVMIYVTRRKSQDRRVANEEEVKRTMEEENSLRLPLVLHSDAPRSPSMKETVEKFSRALVVVGMHGAGLANAIFAQDGTHLVEFSLAEPGTHCYAHLAMAMGFVYWQVGLKDGDSAHGRRYSHVSAEELRSVLQRIPRRNPS
uniref:Glycosyltransferase 61 catalytic domain-containing protein n=1 Tax=Guillardia theta TaxID=55529 RepID=A0A7S4JQZ6_GUITH|mmetsp:Transcript_18123/g.59542  ORF Transcript_18123/g.59542 Transcript_18123/m.59542 type:complete len:666 (+) Transcript_18123:272-2269(+)